MSARARSLAAAALLATACRQDMHDQPRFEPDEACSLFADGRAGRPRVPGTVARGDEIADDLLRTGRLRGELADAFPFPVTAEVLAQGRARFDIHCAPCHGRDGSGDGLIVKRGMTRPPSFHAQRLREAPAGRFVEAMTLGVGVMFDVADRTTAHERWAIASYVRALQRSQSATLADVPANERARLEQP
jgi:mono/diheme cytochrome c family protein